MKKVIKLFLLTVFALTITLLSGCGTTAKDPVEQAKEDFKAFGVTFSKEPTTIVSTYGSSKDGYLAYVDSVLTYVYVVDKKNNKVARIYRTGLNDDNSIFDIYDDPYDTSQKSTFFALELYNDKEGSKLGTYWDGGKIKFHYIPFLVLSHFNKEGKLEITNIQAGKGPRAMHYFDYDEVKNYKDLVNIVYEQMDDLRRIAREKEVKLNLRIYPQW